MLYVRGDNTYIKFINNGNEIRLQSAPKTTRLMPLSSKNWFGLVNIAHNLLNQIEKILLKYCSGHRHFGPGFFFLSILSIKCASTTYMNPFDMLRCEINAFMNYAPFSCIIQCIYSIQGTNVEFVLKIATVIPSLTITTPGIRRLLNNIDPHKASGPDNISGRILKDLQNFTASILTLFFKNHFRLAAYHLTGNMQMLHQHTKKVKNTMQ